MKKFLTLLLAFSLISSSLILTGCSEEEEDLSAKIDEKVTAYQTDLQDSAETLTSTKAICDYLCSWAKAKGVRYTSDGYNNVIMSVKAGKAYKKADPTVVVCSYDPARFKTSIDPIACALYLVKNNENTGKLTVIFTAEKGHDFSGIKKINSKYFTDKANVFCLESGSGNMWSAVTGAKSVYRFTSPTTYTAPAKDAAYRIRIQGLPGGIPDSKISSYPNPVQEIGDLLAYFKTNALIYELANVKGGDHAATYPKSAEATVVIDEDDFDKFEARMQTAIDNFNEDYLENYPDVTYTYEEVPLPARVMTEESLNQTVSLLYTLIDGVYFRDEEENLISLSSIGSVKTSDTSLVILAAADSLTELSLMEIDKQYQIICGLADTSYKKTASQKGWTSDPDSEFIKEVSDAFNQYSGKDMELKDCVPAANTTYIYEKNPKCNIINVSVNEDRLERYTGTILTFMMNQDHEEIES